MVSTWFTPWRALLLVLAVLLALWAASGGARLEAVKVDIAGEQAAVDLPFSRPSTVEPQSFTVTASYRLGRFASDTWHITPDDRLDGLSINGQEVDLSGIPAHERQDFVRGFRVDLGQYLRPGVNTVVLTLWDRGGSGLMGVDMEPAGIPSGFKWGLALLLAAASLAAPYMRLTRWPLINRISYALIIFGNTLQVYLIWRYNPVNHIWSDPERHWSQGTDALTNTFMAVTDPIGYQLYVGALAKLTTGLPGLVWFYTSLLAIAGPWLWYRFLREAAPCKWQALLGWGLLSILPSWMSIYSYYMQETLLLPMLGAALWATWRARRKGTLGAFSVMIIFWIMAGLVRGIAIPMAAVACTYVWLIQPEKVKKALAGAAILILALAPLTYRNYAAVNQFAPHGMSHLVVLYAKSGAREIELRIERDGARWTWSFGSPSTGAQPFAPLSEWRTQREGRYVVEVDLRQGSRDWNAAKDRLAEAGIPYGWIIKENLIFLFFGPSWPDDNRERIVDQINVGLRWIWAPLLVIALAWGGYRARHRQLDWLLPGIIAMWILIQGIVPIAVNEGRYRKPYEGLIIAQIMLLLRPRRDWYGRDRDPVERSVQNA